VFTAIDPDAVPKIKAFFAYFTSTYVGEFEPNSERVIRQPLFPHSTWNKWHETVENLPRTNNNSEGIGIIINGGCAGQCCRIRICKYKLNVNFIINNLK